jgi:uncharacterized protein YecT (DUF1311 family)
MPLLSPHKIGFELPVKFPAAMRATILVFLSCIAISAHAEDKNPRSQDAIKAVEKQFEAADAELNRVYQECLAYPNAGTQTLNALQEAQRHWIQFRDLNALAYTGKGSVDVFHDSNYFYAMTVVTKSRIKELKQLFLAPNHTKRSTIVLP